jgi:major cell surface glycoprotein (TIGR04216 family)
LLVVLGSVGGVVSPGVSGAPSTMAVDASSGPHSDQLSPPTAVSDVETLPTVAGRLSPSTPPEATTIRHTLTLDATAPLPNGTQILLPPSYRPTDVTVDTLTTTSSADPRLVVDSTAGDRTRLRLVSQAPVQNLSIDLTLSHPSVQSATERRLRLLAPNAAPGTANATSLTTYTIQPIGSDRRAGPTGTFDTAAGSGYVYSGATVYQGESDIELRGALSPPLLGVAGNAEGEVLDPPIAREALRGTYANDGKNDTARVTLKQPRITGFRIENQRGVDVSGGSVVQSGADDVAVIAQSNFQDAESLELTVERADGLDITEEVIDSSRVRRETSNGAPVAPEAVAAVSPQPGASGQLGRSIRARHHQTTTLLPAGGAQVTASRRVSETDLDRGGSTTVTTTATVGPTGRIGITEVFSPAVRTADITSVTVDGDPAAPLVATADETGTAVAFQDLAPGATVTVEYTLGVADDDQTYDLTGQVVSGAQTVQFDETTVTAGTGAPGTISAGGRVRWDLDLSELNTQDVTIRVTGSDDFDNGAARSQSSLTIMPDEPRLAIGSQRPSRGQESSVTVVDGVGGATYAVLVSREDLRSTLDESAYTDLFRDVGETEQIGILTEDGLLTRGVPADGTVAAVYATVRVDPDTGQGTTKLRTAHLADDATIRLVQTPGDGVTPGALDTASLRTVDPTISLTSPQRYTTRTETTIAGTTSPGTDAVGIYVRTENGFELIDIDGANGQVEGQISVSDGSFSTSDVDLSTGDAPGNDVVSVPGQYQIGIARAASLSRTGPNGTLPTQLSATEFLGEGTATTTLTVQGPDVSLSRIAQNQTMATTAQEFTVTGQASGAEQVLLVLVDSRGGVTSELRSYNGTGFSEIVRVEHLPAGQADFFAITTGRDGIVGDGELPSTPRDATLAQLATYLDMLNGASLTRQQVAERLLAETELAPASDDRVARTRVSVTQPTVSIERVSSQNTTATTTGHGTDSLRVQGRTNLRVENTPVSLTLRQRGQIRRYALVDNATAGRWTASLPTANLSAGEYTVVADAQDAVDQYPVTLSSPTSSPSSTASSEQSPTDQLATPTQSPTPTHPPASSTAPSTTAISPPHERTSTPTTRSTGPGFGVAIVFVAATLTLCWMRLRRRSHE